MSDTDCAARLAAIRDCDYATLDPGIRDVVRELHRSGYDTTDSGDGVTKILDMECALPYRNVAVSVCACCTSMADIAAICEDVRAILERFTATEWLVEGGYTTHGQGWTVLASEQIPEAHDGD